MRPVLVIRPMTGEIQVPFCEDVARELFAVRAQHHQHAFLAFRQHEFVGGHAGLACRHVVEVQLDADAALAGHFHRGTGQAGGAHVLDGDDGVGGHQFQAGLDQQFFGERIADLHGRALVLGIGGELGRGHGRAVNPVAAGLRADIDHRVADAGGGTEENLVLAGDADGHRVDQRIAVVGGVKIDFAADGGDADAVAVAADAAHHAVDDAFGARVFRTAEPQRVQVGDRPGAHGEDIAQDAADAGRRALVGLDEAGMVVALHLEDGGQPVADIDHAGILARAVDHPRRLGRQLLQPDAARICSCSAPTTSR